MNVSARSATITDLPILIDLYRGLEEEMTALHPMWPLADGLTPPIAESLSALLHDVRVVAVMGEIESYPFGFMIARMERLLSPTDGEVGVIRWVFVEHEAREVGVGEAMLEGVMTRLRQRGITKFDAHVLPGHRLVKNFFEAGGFSARSIVMHHDDAR